MAFPDFLAIASGISLASVDAKEIVSFASIEAEEIMPGAMASSARADAKGQCAKKNGDD